MIPLKDETPTDRVPVVTYALLAANVLAFLWQLETGLELSVLRGGAIPYELFTFRDERPPALLPPPLTVLTSMFLHAGVKHLGFNMLFLWIFGNNVEDALGRVRFVGFYLACGVAAAAAQAVATAAGGGAAMDVPMVGASGAIAGVLAAYLRLFPHARVLTLVFFSVLHVPAILFIGIWFAIQVGSAIFGGDSQVAFMAHVGGFVAGFLLVRRMGRRAPWRARRVRF